MHSNPINQQHGEPGGDTESSMEVDEGPINPSTPPRHITNANIPDQAIQKACEDLGRNIRPDDDNKRILLSLGVVWFLVYQALSQDPSVRPRLASQEEYLSNVKMGEEQFLGLLRDLAKTNSWRDLFTNDIFFKQRPVGSSQSRWIESKESANATIQAWSSDFKGDAAKVLLATIASYLGKERHVYARATSIVNSSGTGKSRMVDEISTKIITVPMCLREDGSQGFPPPDHYLRAWLLSAANPIDQAHAAKQLHSFMYSLLNVTYERLKIVSTRHGYLPPMEDVFASVPRESEEACIDRQAKLASAFRDLMTSGQSFKASNAYRLAFYKEVIERATKVMNHCEEEQKGPSNQSPPRFIFQGKGLKEAGEQLCRFIDPQGVLDLATGPRRPLVVISFDESHILTDNPRAEPWTLFSELRRALRGIVEFPVFSLFLSTAGRFHRFTPEKRLDPSSRIANSILSVLHPISEISFDDIAFPALENTVSLDRVVQMDWISHLGRPLFGTRYDALLGGTKQPELLVFAKQKLLCSSSITLKEDNKAGILACLSVRFALEFNADANALAVACAQVERHMRLCITATSGLEQLVTLAGSEPLLAEAACDLMKQASMDPVCHLAKHSDLNCIDRGRRGELIAALILMQARDKAVAGKRCMSVCEFMRALLPSSAYQELLCHLPNYYRPEEHKEFEKTFKDYRMWFNHVIKIEAAKMISVDSLWKFIMRGAMVVCTHNQFGVDIVLPACVAQQNLSRDTITAILIQVKNAHSYTNQINPKLFNAMDPFLVGLFPRGQSPRPVIRLVFALASPESAVVLSNNSRTREPHHPDDFTAFDVWCAGLSKDTFRHIGDDVTAYKVLLERSLQPHDAFDLEEIDEQPPMEQDVKLMRGRRRRRMAALVMDNAAHSSIHLHHKNSETGILRDTRDAP